MRMFRLLILAATIPVFMGIANAAEPASAWSLLPQPAEMYPAAHGAVTVSDGDRVLVQAEGNAQALAVAQRFAALVATARGLHLRVETAADKSSPAAIVFRLDSRADVANDAGYRIAIGGGKIGVTARSTRGLFYGGVTVWQLLTSDATRDTPAHVADGSIVDHPRFAWRGLMLDSARHFQSVADIKKLIDWMSLNKLNVLHWHLSDDQGWRIRIPNYPELTKIGACRKAVGPDAALTGGPDKPYCGFYTDAEVRDIVRYAAERFIEVVPEIDLPGHSQAAVAAYPWLGVTGERPAVWTDWGISPWLLKPDEQTLHFVDDVLDEVMQLFPSRYISIGGDEADKQQWNASPELQARMRRLGLENMDQLQGWFTARVAEHLVEHGRIPVGWDDELVAGAKLPASEVVMSWHGGDDQHVALEAAAQGHDVVLTPQESLYFDHYQSDLPDEWPGQSPMATLRQAYDTAVIPNGATSAEARRIIGVQGGLWTELMPSFAHDQHALFPRMAALSELGWSAAS